MPMPEETLIKILNGLKSTIDANTKTIISLNFIVFALVKNIPKEQQQCVLDMLKSVSEANLSPEINAELQNTINLFSSLTASNNPEDLRKLFRLISGGKDNS